MGEHDLFGFISQYDRLEIDMEKISEDPNGYIELDFILKSAMNCKNIMKIFIIVLLIIK